MRTGLDRAGVDRVVEVWCDCPPDLALSRYAARARHPGHFDEALVDDLPDVLATAEPLALGPVLRVATDVPSDLDSVVARVREALAS